MVREINKEENEFLESAFRSIRNVKVPEAPHLSMSDIFKAKQAPSFTWLPFGLAAILLVAASVMVVPKFINHSPEQRGLISTSCVVQSVSGKAVIRARGSEVIARAGTFLEEGAAIKVNANSNLYLRGGEELSLLLKENSELKVRELRMDPETQAKQVVLSLMSGHFLCKLDPISPPTTLQIMTPEANFQVVGTQFELIQGKNEGSQLNVFEGTILVTPKDKLQESVYVHEGSSAQISPGKSGVAVSSLVGGTQKTVEEELAQEEAARKAQSNQPVYQKELPPISDYSEEK